MKNKKELIVIFIFGLLPIAYAIWVFQQLWIWIVMPITGLFQLSLIQIVGIMIFIGHITPMKNIDLDKIPEVAPKIIVQLLAKSTLYLIAGWAISFYM